MKATIQRLRKPIFCNSRLDVTKRLFIFQVYVATKGSFQCSTWSCMSDSVYGKFHECIMYGYRLITGHYHGNPFGKDIISDDDLLCQYDVMYPHTMIRVSRMIFLSRLDLKAPNQLMSLVKDLAADAVGWAKLLQEDLRWLTASTDSSACAGVDFGQWIEFVQASPKKFNKYVRTFSRSRLANVPLFGRKQVRPPEPGGYACTSCPMVFGTLQKLSLHCFKAHGIKNVWRTYVGYHLYCSICLRMFWTRERLINHVRDRSPGEASCL